MFVCVCASVYARERERYMMVVCMGEHVSVSHMCGCQPSPFICLKQECLFTQNIPGPLAGQQASGHRHLLSGPPLLPQKDCDYACR